MIKLNTEKWSIENIKTVLFDKDGTFIDLHFFWGKMTQLRALELIKIKAQRNIPEPITKIAREICDACKCELVGVIGNKILVFKPTEKPKFAHLLDNYKYYY